MKAADALTRTFRKVLLRGGSPYWYCRKYLEMARTPTELVRRRRIAARFRRTATPAEILVVRQLNEHGYVVLQKKPDLTTDLIAECNRRLQSYLSEHRSHTVSSTEAKFFWRSLITGDDLTTESVFIRYALQEPLVRQAAMYLGEAPYLSDVAVQYSFEVPDHAPTHSQRWHKDADDTRIFKVFVYCSDVLGEDDGPLHVADRRAPRGVFASPLLSSLRYDDDRFYAIANRRLTHAIIGPAGTTFICDTQRSFHYGSRCRRPRLACWFSYQSYAGLYPVRPRPAPPCATPYAYVLSRRMTTRTPG